MYTRCLGEVGPDFTTCFRYHCGRRHGRPFLSTCDQLFGPE